MKRLFKVGALLLIVVLSLCACQKKEEAPPTETQSPLQEENAFYQSIVESDARPVAVMIDNDNQQAWPHAGLDDAYQLYEIFVEGGATRIMALFKNVSPEKIGPVRSSRHYFLDYVLENDALYVHSGWSPRAQSDIPKLGINNVNGILGTDAAPFWREEEYKGDYHSLFTSMEKLQALFDQKGYRKTTDQTDLLFGKSEEELSDGLPASSISIPYTSGFYEVSYAYNAETESYDRSMNQTAHTLQNGAVVSPKNVIIQYAKNYLLAGDDKRQEVETTAGGTGYYCTGGKCIEITWSKASRSDRTIYCDKDGNELTINPGQTFIQIVPPQAAVSIH